MSVDEADMVKIWNLKKGDLVSTLNRDSLIYDIKDIGVVNQGNKLAARDSEGITFWNLQQSLQNLSFNNMDIGYSRFMILKEGNHMMYSFDDMELIKIDLKNNMNFIKKVAISETMYDMKLVGNGDALIKDEFFPEQVNKSKNQINDDYQFNDFDDDYWFRISYLDFDKAVDIEGNSTLNTTLNSQATANVQGEYTLIVNKDEFSAYNIITNKGLKSPFVFENDRLEQHVQFYDDMDEEMLWKGKVYAGTVKGDCYLVEFYFTKGNRLRIKSEELFKNGEPCSTIDEKEDKIIENTILDNNGTLSNKVIEKPKLVLKVHDCKILLEEDVEIVVLAEKYNMTQTARRCIVYVRKAGGSEWSKASFNTKHMHNFYESNYFKINRMNNTESEDVVKFYLASSIGMAIVAFKKDENEVKILKYRKKYVVDSKFLCYSHYQNLFYIPNKNMVQVWNETLELSSYNMDFESEVLNLVVAENDTKQRLLVYDDSNYYEIDLITLNFRRKTKIIGPNIPTRTMPFNLNLFPKNRVFQVPFFKEEVFDISFIVNLETLNLKEFPFHYLQRCFSKEDYYRPVKKYAVYYFKKLKALNYEDTLYGPLNPLFFAVYHNDMTLLEDLLDHYRYPKQIKEYLSPLAFSFINNYNSAVKVFCDRLFKRNYNVSFSRLDFKYLLKSQFSYCHKLMATIPSEPTLQNFPRLLYMSNAVKLHYVQEVGHLLFAMKTQERKILLRHNKKRKNIKKKKIQMLREKKKMIQNEGITKTEVVSFQIPFKYSYKIGTPDSVKFLDAYSQSNTEEFILSEWKEVIIHKWKSHRLFHIMVAILYWVFTIFTTLSIIFFKSSYLFEIISLSFIGIFILFEILQVISYSAFKIKRYFEGAWNYIDWMCFSMLILYYLLYHKEIIISHANRVLGSAGLMVMFYRSFSYLRIINAFTTLIGMINTIIQKLIIFFLILIYFFVTSGLLIMKLNPQENSILSLGNAYVWTFFGGIEGSDFKSYDFAGIPIIFGTVMVTIILLNVLIAFLSNLFSRLEDQQKSNDLKEKASMILDLEIIFHFFRYILTGKSSKLKKFEKIQENFYVELLDPSKNATVVSADFLS